MKQVTRRRNIDEISYVEHKDRVSSGISMVTFHDRLRNCVAIWAEKSSQRSLNFSHFKQGAYCKGQRSVYERGALKK